MLSPKKILNSQIVILILFAISWIFECKFSMSNSEWLFLPRIINIILLGAFYIITEEKKYNYGLFGFLICAMLTSVFFSFNPNSVSGMVFFSLSRLALIIILFNFKDKLDKRHFLPVISLFTIALGAILYIIYKNTLFFYLSAVATLLLAILLSFSFIALLSVFGSKGKGSIEFFVAVCLFLITDTLFSSQKVTGINQSYIIVISSIYYVAYVFIIKSVLKKSNR